MAEGKKLFSALLALVLIFSILPITSNAAGQSEPVARVYEFLDMPNDWSTEALEEAIANGLLVGADRKIMPDANLTRAQMATIIVRAFGAYINGDLTAFTDIKSTDWFEDSMAKGFQMGILKGWNGKMNPNDTITRQEVFVILARALRLQPAKTISKTFTDVSAIAGWAQGEVYALVNGGYIEGYNGKLAPTDTITRAEFAQLMHNLLKQYINKPGEVTAVSDGNIMINAAGVTLKNLIINGDLIIGDGVGDGEVVLVNVQVTGRMVVRGGGELIISGFSVVSDVVLSRIDGGVSIKVSPEADVEMIYIDDNSNNVTLHGTIGTVTVAASDIVVTLTDAFIDKLFIIGKNLTLIVGANSTANTVMLQRTAINTTVAVEGRAAHIITGASGTDISGSGKVIRVEVLSGATGSSIHTAGTQIVVDDGVTGVTGSGGTPIAGGTTVTNNTSGTGIITSGSTNDSPLLMVITNLGITNSTTVTFESNISGARIRWNGVYLKVGENYILTVSGLNTITVPAMTANAINSLSLIKAGYSTFTDSELQWRPVDTITVIGVGEAATVVNGGTLQMIAAVSPSDATNTFIDWSIQSGSGSAAIHASTGLLTAETVGTVNVYAAAVDGSGVIGSKQIIIYPAAPNYTIDYTAEKTAQIIPVTEEYSTDNGTSWAAGTGTHLTLTPGENVQFRVRASDVVPAGLTQTLIVANRPDTPAYAINFTAEKIDGFCAGDAYSLDGFATAGMMPGAGDLALTGALAPNAAGGATKQLSIKTLATPESFDSAVQIISIPAKPANTTVGDYNIDYVAETTLQDVALTEEYSADGGSTWETGTNTPCSLTPGVNVLFRLRATECGFASETKTLAVPVRPVGSSPAFAYAIGSRNALYGLPNGAANLEARISSDAGTTWGSWLDITVNAAGQALLAHDGGDLLQVRINAVPGIAFAGESAVQYSKQALGDLEIGSKVVDNSWSWAYKTGDNYTGSGETGAVSWIVVAKDHYGDASGVTLLSEKLIGKLMFDNRTDVHWGGVNHWGNSTHIRPWLNSTGTYEVAGFYNAFSEAFKNVVLTTSVPNMNYTFPASYAYITLDKIFIPSTTEMGDADYSKTYEIGMVYPYFAGATNADRIAKLGTSNTSYWTRSPEKTLIDIVHCFLSDGRHGVNIRSENLQAKDNNGVRPALNLAADVLISGTPNNDGQYEIFYE